MVYEIQRRYDQGKSEACCWGSSETLQIRLQDWVSGDRNKKKFARILPEFLTSMAYLQYILIKI